MSRNLQEHILQTASDLFYQQGIRNTGVDTIVKAAGIAKMSLYKYFPSKDDLILAHLQRSEKAMLELLRQGMAEKKGTPQAQLLAVFEVFENMLSQEQFHGCPFIKAASEFAADSNPVQQATANFYQTFCSVIAEQAKLVGVADPEQLAEQWVLLISGALIREQMQRNSGAIFSAAKAGRVLLEQALNLAE